MQPITVSVGSLAAASANNIALTQTPNSGTGLVLAGSLAIKSGTWVATIATNVMTVTSVTTGAIFPGMIVNGPQVLAGTKIVGYGTGTGLNAGTYILSNSQTVAAPVTMYGNASAVLDKPRQVLLTTTADETAHTLTLTGTDWAGGLATEVVTGVSGATVASALSYLTVTSAVWGGGNAAGAVTLGTNTVASSPWARLDGWANPSVAKQVAVVGTVNYTVQYSMDDPNLFTGAVAPSAMTWFNDMNTEFVTTTAGGFDLWAFVPVWARLVLNSGTGTATMTLQQTGAAPY